MKPKEKREFLSLIFSAATLYEKDIKPEVAELYWDALKDMELPAVRAALARHQNDGDRGRFMPKPADIRHFSGEREPSAMLAWEDVLNAMEQRGAYATVLFEDAVTNAIIRDMGGWPGLCHRQATDEQDVWLQREFCRRYDEYRRAGRMRTEPLAGLHAESNRAKALPEYAPDPHYIGSCQPIPKALTAAYNGRQITDGEGWGINELVGKLADKFGNPDNLDEEGE